ncbi:MAG: hypothetical protein ACLU9S_05010 [Oscillospiraceae bacterium]
MGRGRGTAGPDGGKQPDGAAMGIRCADDVSGELTTNLGMLGESGTTAC